VVRATRANPTEEKGKEKAVAVVEEVKTIAGPS
jgi:hypothetical protein